MERLLLKLGSVKTWVALWCMGVLTYMVAADRLDNAVASILAGAVVAFIGANVAQKKIEADRAHTREKEGDV